MAGVKVGDRVRLLGKALKGEVAFNGETHFSDGIWTGIILDKPNGRHNGTVDGKQYFKCSRNHGIFVRSYQVEKECLENTEGCGDNKTSTRNAYPNYLKASSKLKRHKHVCESKNVEPKTELKVKKANEEINKYCSPGCDTGISELRAVKEENKTLKDKQKASEKSMKDAQHDYCKATKEIKQLKEDLECKKNQIKVQKFNIKLLKKKQCNHCKKADFSVASSKKSKVSNAGDCLDGQSHLVDEDLHISDDEFDLESKKTLASVQRIVELEEQNRILIQGLVELREFLQSMCQSQHLGYEIPNMKSNCRKKVKNVDSLRFSSFLNQSAAAESKNSLPPEASAPHLKEYCNMLLEMTKFSEYVKDKNKLIKDFGAHNSRNFKQAGDFNPNQNEYESVYKMPQRSYQLPSKAENNESRFDISNIQVKPEALQNSLASGSNNFSNHFQTTNMNNSQKFYNLKRQKKVYSQLCSLGDTVPSKCEDPATESTQLIPSEGVNPKLFI